MKTDDPVELLVAEAFDRAGVRYIHESDNKDQRLDFWLPDQSVMVECKQFHTDRVAAQIAPHPNVIVIQGMGAARAFAAMIAAPPRS